MVPKRFRFSEYRECSRVARNIASYAAGSVLRSFNSHMLRKQLTAYFPCAYDYMLFQKHGASIFEKRLSYVYAYTHEFSDSEISYQEEDRPLLWLNSFH